MNVQPKGEILTLAQAAEQLGVSTRTLMRFMDKGEIHGFMIGKRWKFTRSEIIDYLKRQQQKDPTYLSRQIAEVRNDWAKVAKQIEDIMGQLTPEHEQEFINGFFDALSESKAGQQIIESIERQRESTNS